MNKVEYKRQQLTRALGRLDEAIALEFPSPETKADSVIQRFEFSVELFWKYLRELLLEKGLEVNASPIDVMRVAKTAGYIKGGDEWIEMIRDRNLTSHIYDDAKAMEIYERIVAKYAPMMTKYVKKHGK
ncbi:MAG: nucleotidyltransferase substrate binding protein [Candidatus Nomurabacteria bacterium]|jgi:nucleotidyltransferase substrate binding protein (TIGR01987 family)|nr:nucleotidyltransferase substrate binding protein [Candidatus Nomurabacteria bacterium]